MNEFVASTAVANISKRFGIKGTTQLAFKVSRFRKDEALKSLLKMLKEGDPDGDWTLDKIDKNLLSDEFIKRNL